MAHRPNLTGRRFGRLLVVSLAGSEGGARMWSCICDCRESVLVSTNSLMNGQKSSCGCLHKEMFHTGRNRTHGLTGTPEYRVWSGMKSRCLNAKNPAYKHYGGRGIGVCDQWSNSFEVFLAHVGNRPAGHTMDRIDVNRGYEPGNVRWATPLQQARNTRFNRFLTIDGVVASLSEHCESRDVSYGTVLWRLNRGWAIADLFKPTINQRKTRILKETQK